MNLGTIIKESFTVIGRHKYHQLKRYNFNEMTAEEMVNFRGLYKISVGEAEKRIAKYEEKHKVKGRSAYEIAYDKRVRNPIVVKPKMLNKEELKNVLFSKFVKEYFIQNKRKYILEGDYLNNLKPIFFYFLGDFENFIKCKNVLNNDDCVPSLDKGLLIVGDFGNGKTSTMEAFAEILKRTKKKFKVIGTKEAVTKFSFLKNDNEGQEKFYKELINRSYLFDDLLKEDKASSYGKVNLIEQVLEEKQRKKVLTHATLNYKIVDGETIRDIETAIEQLGDSYGGYLYDRVFSMFNIIEFKGGSLRK
ncbi:hypothetical protein J2Q11_12365 [Tenacibaculum finnmarkense genomovar finnmarkense]|uniref:hypothetical protein n=1 Tax=Tenacibaculum finnmarkense TaxID=2781243 RepID=UPI001EFA8977|nr:hypothetical protein [Tenacibaculum finnmarkense]MCG8213581.1 hypothetical protein [Tenacibaculum finnmarkense genomovar finnmarkense]MCG8231924.1 hypothetical protein [Tenacibaculum finnmarkense genomovar finnmarkense]MCG8886462.1 hypothetical protein [Tenacibaculum finnmarkense]MCG8897244.1 hypothetical protein [Tenacibaculum finnmarkense]MCG8903978.1 hypothetical protein [Tenacibaculum finnmarkense]